MLEFLASFIIKLIGSTSYAGIFALMALESALIPIPSEVTMPFSGFLASSGKLSLVTVIIVGTIGNLIGSYIAYYLGYFIKETILLNFIRKYGKFILISEHDYLKASEWFTKYGNKIIFISRLLPGVRTIVSLPAGVFKMDIKKFTLYTVLGCLIWSTILAYIGFVLGENWMALEGYFREFEIVIVLSLVITAAWYLRRHFKTYRSKDKS